jgi:hypothetical protein
MYILMYFRIMPDLTPEALRRTAAQLEEEAAAVRRAVHGLTDLAGPHAWEGAQPRRVAQQVADAVSSARHAADLLDAQRATAVARAGELERAHTLRSLPTG